MTKTQEILVRAHKRALERFKENRTDRMREALVDVSVELAASGVVFCEEGHYELASEVLHGREAATVPGAEDSP